MIVNVICMFDCKNIFHDLACYHGCNNVSSGSLTLRFVYTSKVEVLCLCYVYGASEHTWSGSSIAYT